MLPLQDQIEKALPDLPLAEQQMARFFIRNRGATVLGSAAQIAEKAGTSDATVVRTARSLGYAGLAELREALLADLVNDPKPADRLQRTLTAAGDTQGGVLAHTLAVHQDSLARLAEPEFAAAFERAVALLGAAPHRFIFGIGPSGTLADYAALQFGRIGLTSTSLNAAGIALADRLLAMRKGDAVLAFAYAPMYREIKVTLERAKAIGAAVVLVSDSLAQDIDDGVAETLSVPRGKAGHLSMHGGTMVLLDAMVAGLAALDGPAALESLTDFADLRGALDKSWSKRGVRRPRRRPSSQSSEGAL